MFEHCTNVKYLSVCLNKNKKFFVFYSNSHKQWQSEDYHPVRVYPYILHSMNLFRQINDFLYSVKTLVCSKPFCDISLFDHLCGIYIFQYNPHSYFQILVDDLMEEIDKTDKFILALIFHILQFMYSRSFISTQITILALIMTAPDRVTHFPIQSTWLLWWFDGGN